MAYVVTNAGRAIVTNLLSGLGGTVPKYLGWGSGTSAAAAADTALGSEYGEARTTATVSRVTTSVANDTMRISGTITAGGTRTVTEVGVFDAASSGNMAIRGVHAAVGLSSGEGIAYTIDWQQA